jgi:hypothetical protein
LITNYRKFSKTKKKIAENLALPRLYCQKNLLSKAGMMLKIKTPAFGRDFFIEVMKD